MYSRNDPRLRRTLNQLSQNLESANETAQVNLFTFSRRYVNPCFSSLGNCFHACTTPCFPTREERLRRQRGRSRGRAEQSFDFYDDWDEDENEGLLGWANEGNDELDRLLAGTGGSAQPGRQRAMSYGARRGRRKSAGPPHDGEADPTVIPSQSYFGFLGRLPWKIGGKGLRYKPSAADLQEHPGTTQRTELENQPLTEEDEEEERFARTHKRVRSQTTGSGHTTDSLSSRGDIFPSEDELDDAIPLDDEFATVLERRTTGLGSDENSSGKTRSGKRPSGSRPSTRTPSSRSAQSGQTPAPKITRGNSGIEEVPTLSELKQEEERAQREEEQDVERKRDAARRLALERGLSTTRQADSHPPSVESKEETAEVTPPVATVQVEDPQTPTPPRTVAQSASGPIPFPAFDPSATPDISPDVAEDETSSLRSETPAETSHPPAFVPAQLPSFAAKPD
ncbi:hypothetical protein W97_05956 [Coniosporium apollinis CBS 100218]|uniref:Uncharacterized protein n=1 Tax=Coniosporium apollinis (strain CBS 100218) TaxID=1168221 RepID=R7YXP3_CONA1|nr:uncharacterized protein W97_05956 [Coniosporium apollinis CBS 100218]EON66710.1 hypothetical protein W97_05956 [Coniosporium apollinis CBS 100218]